MMVERKTIMRTEFNDDIWRIFSDWKKAILKPLTNHGLTLLLPVEQKKKCPQYFYIPVSTVKYGKYAEPADLGDMYSCHILAVLSESKHFPLQ